MDLVPTPSPPRRANPGGLCPSPAPPPLLLLPFEHKHSSVENVSGRGAADNSGPGWGQLNSVGLAAAPAEPVVAGGPGEGQLGAPSRLPCHLCPGRAAAASPWGHTAEQLRGDDGTFPRSISAVGRGCPGMAARGQDRDVLGGGTQQHRGARGWWHMAAPRCPWHTDPALQGGVWAGSSRIGGARLFLISGSWQQLWKKTLQTAELGGTGQGGERGRGGEGVRGQTGGVEGVRVTVAWTGCRDMDGHAHGPICSVPVPGEQRLGPFWGSQAMCPGMSQPLSTPRGKLRHAGCACRSEGSWPGPTGGSWSWFSHFRGPSAKSLTQPRVCERRQRRQLNQEQQGGAGGRGAQGSPAESPRSSLCHNGGLVGHWRAPPWCGCAGVAPVTGCPVPPSPGLGNRRWRDGVTWGQRLGTALVCAGRAGPCPPEPVAPQQPRPRGQGWDPVPAGTGHLDGAGGALCAGVSVHAWGCVCTPVPVPVGVQPPAPLASRLFLPPALV